MERFTALMLMALNSENAEIGPRVTNPVTWEPSVMASAITSLEIVSQKKGGNLLLTAMVATSALWGLRYDKVTSFISDFGALRFVIERIGGSIVPL
jgi:hypothetical protein